MTEALVREAISVFPMHIGGKAVPAESGQWIDSFDPFTGKVWSRVARGGAADVDKAVRSAHKTKSVFGNPQPGAMSNPFIPR